MPISKEDMIKYTETVNKSYLLGLDSAEERRDLCRELLEEIKKFSDLKAPYVWEDCINNPGVYNELKRKRNNE